VDRELEVIRDEMEQTRASLADKLGTLENQVRETVSGASEAVSSTVEGVKEVVSNVTDTVESVTETLNISKQVEQHPWAAVGIAVATGFIASQLIGRSSRSDSERAAEESRRYEPTAEPRLTPYLEPAPAPAPTPQPRQEEESSMLSGLESMLPDLKGIGNTVVSALGGLAVGSVMNVVRDLVVRGLPQEWHGDLTGMVDQVTRQLGGKPLPPFKEEEEQPAEQHEHTGEQTAHQSAAQRHHEQATTSQPAQETSRGRRGSRNQPATQV
jgi:ElaB/YqjD/DUF883 family membrane-anchored ribosome-binding protein